MSSERTTEILNYLSAISREVGEMRTELNGRINELNNRINELSTRLDETNMRLLHIEREQRQFGRRLERIEGFLLVTKSDIGDLQDRVTALEEKQT